MQVKSMKDYADVKAGSVIEVSDKHGALLIETGIAEPVDPKQKIEKQKPESEAAK